MRLFIAVNLNIETREHVLRLQSELREQAQSGHYTAPQNLHLTLIFLGECDDWQKEKAVSVLDEVVFEPFDMIVERMGRFRRDRGDIWWAGVRNTPALRTVQQDLFEQLKDASFELEKRRFRPHITLARSIHGEAKPREISSFAEHVTRIDLMVSERIGGRLVYTPIHSINATLR
ncbi:MAG: RNA 2',3'-cyclic phosphodiesterase [Coriobacteriia bacterium]|nr:RNA 2',3'-cyclic phosphodiesterase [Coriobacteriia bacterium]